MSLTVNIHTRAADPGSFKVETYTDKLGKWASVDLDPGVSLFVSDPDVIDGIIDALRRAKAFITGPDHAYVRPGQVAPDRPAPDSCMVCGQPEAAHGGAA